MITQPGIHFQSNVAETEIGKQGLTVAAAAMTGKNSITLLLFRSEAGFTPLDFIIFRVNGHQADNKLLERIQDPRTIPGIGSCR